MPVSASVQDIYDSLIMSHELGVKCIAIFRAGSKANAVYVVDTPETRMFKANHVWEQLVNAGSDAIDEIIAEASKPRQRKLPGRRLGQTVKFSVGGQLTGYLTVGVYADGTCGEVFGRLGQVGSFASGMFEAYCKLLSTAPSVRRASQGSGQGVSAITPSEPSGFCRVGDDTGGGHLHGNPLLRFRGGFDCQDPGVAFRKQRLPPAGRILHPQRQPSGPGSGYDGKRAAPRIITAPAHPATPALPEIPAGKVPEGTMLNGASLCPQCHSWPMSRTANANPAAPADTRTAAAGNKR